MTPKSTANAVPVLASVEKIKTPTTTVENGNWAQEKEVKEEYLDVQSPVLRSINFKTKKILSQTLHSTVYKTNWNGTAIVLKKNNKMFVISKNDPYICIYQKNNNYGILKFK